MRTSILTLLLAAGAALTGSGGGRRPAAAPRDYSLTASWTVPLETPAGGFCPRHLAFDKQGRLIMVSTCLGQVNEPGARTDAELSVVDAQGQRLSTEWVDRGRRRLFLAGAALNSLSDTLFYSTTDLEEVKRRDLATASAPAVAWQLLVPSGSASAVPGAMAAGADGSVMLFAGVGLARYGPGIERRNFRPAELGPGQAAVPGSVAVDTSGAAYVTDASLTPGIHKFGANGQPVAGWAPAGGQGPAGPVAAYPGKDELYLLAGDSALRVDVLAPDGSLLRTLPAPPSLRASPRPLLAVAPDGGYALAGETGSQVVLFLLGPDGAERGNLPLRSLGRVAARNEPRLDVAADGRVAVFTGESDLKRFQADGTALAGLELAADVMDLGWLADGGLVATSDLGGAYAVTRYLPDGSQGWRKRFNTLSAPGVAAGERFAYVPDVDDGSVMAMALADGAVAGYLAPGTEDLGPGDLDLGPDGRLLLLDRARGRVTTLDPEGPATSLRSEMRAGAPGTVMAAAAGPAGLVAVVAAGGVAVLDATGTEWWRMALPPAGTQAVDLAFAADGHLAVLLRQTDPRTGALTGLLVRVYAPVGALPAGPSPTPPATPPSPDGGACRVTGEKRAEPADILLGEAVTVTLTVAGTCPELPPSPADVVLVVDVSESMAGAPEAAAGAAVQAFVEETDLALNRVGVVLFNNSASLRQPLTADLAALKALPVRLGAAGGTAIDLGLRAADEHLKAAARSGARQVIVLLSDGDSPAAPAQAAADAARARGVRIYSVALGSSTDLGLLLAIAGNGRRLFRALGPEELDRIYRQIAVTIGRAGRDVAVWDALSSDVAYVEGSVAPPPWSPAGAGMTWRSDRLSATPLVLSYRVRPLHAGRVPTNREAWFDYQDADGTLRRFVYPVPYVNVHGPTATPTITPTPTVTPVPTATPVPRPLFLPVLSREHCFPAVAHADVVLALDSSSSMTGEKLASAVAAARLFLDALRLPEDRAAIVGYSEEATVLAPFGADRASLDAALAGIAVQSGTRIDRALAVAGDLLLAADRPKANKPVVVLLSDGRHSGAGGEVSRAAARLRDVGIVIYTVAFGDDADRALLADIAGSTSRALTAVDAATLAAVYRQIAGAIVCR